MSAAGSRSSATPTGSRTRTTPTPDTRDLVGYPAPTVDHKAERQEALDRWNEIR